MEAESLSWFAGCDTNCMDRIFLCLLFHYSTSNRDGDGRIVICIVIITTQKTPVLSHFISSDIFFTGPPLYSKSNRLNAFSILPFSQLGSFYKRISWCIMTYPNPNSHQGYVEALSHTTASLRLQICYQPFFAVLLWVCENAQLILCSLTTSPASLTFPGWSYPPLGSSCGDVTAQRLCCPVNIHITSLDHK